MEARNSSAERRSKMLPVSIGEDRFLASAAELGAFDVETLDGVAGGHDAAPVGAVPEAEGVAEFVGRFFEEAIAQQVRARRHAVELLFQARGGYHGAIAVELRLAENESQDGHVEVG